MQRLHKDSINGVERLHKNRIYGGATPRGQHKTVLLTFVLKAQNCFKKGEKYMRKINFFDENALQMENENLKETIWSIQTLQQSNHLKQSAFSFENKTHKPLNNN